MVLILITSTTLAPSIFVVCPLAAPEQRKEKIGLAAQFPGARAGLVLVLLIIAKEGFHLSWQVRKKKKKKASKFFIRHAEIMKHLCFLFSFLVSAVNEARVLHEFPNCGSPPEQFSLM